MTPVLAGGGTRLPAHVGMPTALKQIQYGIEQLAGVSGGSIVAWLYACGYSTDCLKNLASDVDFRRFLGYVLPKLLFAGGMSTGERFESWLDEQLNGATFRHLECDLHVVATDVCSGEPMIFDRERSSDFSVARAVQFSKTIPLLFTFEKYKDHPMVYGSFLAEDALYQDWAADDTPAVYLRLRWTHEASAVKESAVCPLPDYLTRLIRTFTTSISREYISTDYWRNSVVAETGDSPPLEFSLSVTHKENLLRCGLETVRTMLQMRLGLEDCQMAGLQG